MRSICTYIKATSGLRNICDLCTAFAHADAGTIRHRPEIRAGGLKLFGDFCPLFSLLVLAEGRRRIVARAGHILKSAAGHGHGAVPRNLDFGNIADHRDLLLLVIDLNAVADMQFQVWIRKGERHGSQRESLVVVVKLLEIQLECRIIKPVAYVLIIDHQRITIVSAELVGLVFLRGLDFRERHGFVAVIKLHQFAGGVFTDYFFSELIHLKIAVVVDVSVSAVPFRHAGNQLSAGIRIDIVSVIRRNHAVIPDAVEDDIVE